MAALATFQGYIILQFQHPKLTDIVSSCSKDLKKKKYDWFTLGFMFIHCSISFGGGGRVTGLGVWKQSLGENKKG